MRTIIINVITMGGMGYLCGTQGFTVATWQFWVFVIIGAILIINNNGA